MFAALTWSPTPEVLYREIAGAKQLCSEFRFMLKRAPGYKGEAGFISFDSAGRVTIKPGYCWDGASGPTIDTPDSVCAALGHDVQYELMSANLLPYKVYRPLADLWFYERLLTDGMVQYRAFAWYKAVQVFGGLYGRPGSGPILRRAPIPFRPDVVEFEPIPGYLTI